MTLTVEQRRALSMLRAKVREIEKPDKAATRKRLQASRKARSKAIGKAAAEQRQERQHDKAYLAHTRRQPCILAHLNEGCDGRTDPAHLRYGNLRVGRKNPGMGAKSDDRWALPLCRKHHTEQHAAGNEPKWWAGKGIDPDAECLRRHAGFKAADKSKERS